MNRRAHRIGRGLTCLGLLSTAGYLGWRVATLPSQPPVWLVALAIVVEIAGFIGSGMLDVGPVARTARRRQTAAQRPADARVDAVDVDVVVRVDDQPIHQIRATLLSLRSMTDRPTRRVDLQARPEVASLAAEFAAVYAATDLEDHNGLKTCSAASSTPIFFLLDAGDIPSARRHRQAAAVDARTTASLSRSGQSLMADDDSAEHGPNGLHELTFERETLNPALGARGAAIFSDSGALIRSRRGRQRRGRRRGADRGTGVLVGGI